MTSLLSQVENTMTKSSLGTKGFIFSRRFSLVSRGRQGRNLGVGTEAQTMEKCCLLPCSPAHIRLLILPSPGPHGQGWYHGLSLPIRTTNQENKTQSWPQVTWSEQVLSRSSSSPGDTGLRHYVKLTKPDQPPLSLVLPT